MSDTISRQAAVDEVERLHDVAWKNWKETRISANTMIDALKDLPSTGPEIIRCKECKHWYEDADSVMCCEYTDMSQPEDGFCNWAERREGDADVN